MFTAGTEISFGETRCDSCHETTETSALQSWQLSETLLRPLCVRILPHLATNQAPTSCHTVPEEMVRPDQVSGHGLTVSAQDQWWPGPTRTDNHEYEAILGKRCHLHVRQGPYGKIHYYPGDTKGGQDMRQPAFHPFQEVVNGMRDDPGATDQVKAKL